MSEGLLFAGEEGAFHCWFPSPKRDQQLHEDIALGRDYWIERAEALEVAIERMHESPWGDETVWRPWKLWPRGPKEVTPPKPVLGFSAWPRRSSFRLSAFDAVFLNLGGRPWSL